MVEDVEKGIIVDIGQCALSIGASMSSLMDAKGHNRRTECCTNKSDGYVAVGKHKQKGVCEKWAMQIMICIL